MARNTVSRALHDLGLSAWFGGTLANAVALNAAAAEAGSSKDTGRVANAGWDRWTPINAVAIGAHLVGGAQLLKANKGRVATQQGVLANTNLKMALTAGALAATGYARVLGKKMQKYGDVPVAGGTNATASTPPEVAKAQKQLSALQWAIPALTGTLLVMDALMGEQQRPTEVATGVAKRFLPAA